MPIWIAKLHCKSALPHPQLHHSNYLGKQRWVPFKPEKDTHMARQKPALYPHVTNWTGVVWTKMTHQTKSHLTSPTTETWGEGFSTYQNVLQLAETWRSLNTLLPEHTTIIRIQGLCVDLRRYICTTVWMWVCFLCLCLCVPTCAWMCDCEVAGFCMRLKGGPVGGPKTCSGLLKSSLLLNHTDVLGLLWPYRTLQGPSMSISRLKDAQRGSQKGCTTVTSAEVSVNENATGNHVTN